MQARLATRPKRREYRKSSRGCLTCRIRKVKCDETLPFCTRCTTTGRKCEGPQPPEFQFVQVQAKALRSKSPSPTPVVARSLSTSPFQSGESRSFHYFLLQVAPILSGTHDSSFWCCLVPQLSHSSETVLSATLTISALFENPQTLTSVLVELNTPCWTVGHPHYHAMRWYAKAIHGFRKSTESSAGFPLMEIISCVLLTTIEFLLNNTTGALNLLDKGCNLLHSTLSSYRNDSTCSITSTAQDLIVSFFLRHTILAAPSGQPPLLEWINKTAKDALSAESLHPPNLESVCLLFHGLLQEAHKLTRWAQIRRGDSSALLKLVPLQDYLFRQLEDWRSMVGQYLCESNEKPENSTKVLPDLFMYYEVTYICVACCLDPQEMIFDMYKAHFENILSHAELVFERQDKIEAPKRYHTLGRGIVPPLYFVANKCRDRTVRRKALALLHLISKDEGLWSAIPVLKLVEKIIEIEEECMPGYVEDFTSTSDILPNATQRVRHLDIMKNAVSNQAQFTIIVTQYSIDATGKVVPTERVVSL